MKFTEKMLEVIDKAYTEKRSDEEGHIAGLGINVRNSLKGASVFRDDWEVCELEELDQMITELAIMRDTIKDATGLY